jgi:EH_Signature domain
MSDLLIKLPDLEQAINRLAHSTFRNVMPTFNQALEQHKVPKPIKVKPLTERDRLELATVWQQAKQTRDFTQLRPGQLRDLLSLEHCLQDLELITCLQSRQPWNTRLLTTVLRAYLNYWLATKQPDTGWQVLIATELEQLAQSKQQHHQAWYQQRQVLLDTQADYALAKQYTAALADNLIPLAEWVENTLPRLQLSTAKGSLVDCMRRCVLPLLDIQSLPDITLTFALNQLVNVQQDGEWLSQLILTVSTEHRETVKTWFLKHAQFGDPRLGQIKQWGIINKEAQSTFTGWLSQEDLEFFFSVILPGYDDPHGRRVFWEQYLPLVSASRVLISEYDRYRCRSILDQMKKDGKTLPGKSEGSSIFIMKITDMYIVEFSETGNAAYVYKEEKLKLTEDNTPRLLIEAALKFETKYRNTKDSFKNKSYAERHFRHHSGWQDECAWWLRRHGIRPAIE